MKKITLLLLLIFPLFLFSQNPYTFNGSYSLTGNTSFPSAFGLGNGNCGNGITQTIIINGDLNLNGRTLNLRNVNLIVYGNLNGGGSITTCSSNSSYCVRGAIQNNPNISVTRNYDCTPPPSCTKTWTGTQSTNWNNSANWSPAGIPTINCDVIINNNVNCIVSTKDAEAKTITISNTGSLTLNNSGIVRVKGSVNTSATASFLIENASSLIQIDNVANSGNIQLKRNTTISKLDYVYWSSPVASFNTSQVSPNSSLIYKWVPTNGNNFNGFGNWAGAANQVMALGKGYIIRAPNNLPTNTAQNFTATFTGVPSNGTINTPIARGNYAGNSYMNGNLKVTEDDDNWNLIGNPYPSAINAVRFLNSNTSLDGFVRVWTHNTSVSANNDSPFYGNFTYNYSPDDYLLINGTGTSIPGALSVIGTGQGFFVKMNHNSASPSGNATFTNDMRGTDVSNNQFYRSANTTYSEDTDEKHRIWLNLVNPNQIATSLLVGYVEEATNGVDRIYDAETKLKNNFEVYSIVDNQYFNIQGKALPFTATDEVPLGFTTNQNGIHTFGLTAVDGLFEGNQEIYIQDLELNVIHNLKESPYSFTTEAGNNNTRFVLKFSNETLGNEDFINNESVVIYTNDVLNIEANENIKEVLVYDMLGRLIFQNKKVNSNKYRETQVLKSNSPLLIQVILENNIKIVKKIIY